MSYEQCKRRWVIKKKKKKHQTQTRESRTQTKQTLYRKEIYGAVILLSLGSICLVRSYAPTLTCCKGKILYKEHMQYALYYKYKMLFWFIRNNNNNFS